MNVCRTMTETSKTHDSETGTGRLQINFDDDEIEPVDYDADGVSGNLLGWQIIFTVGDDFTVPGEWYDTKASDLGIPQRMWPSKTTPKRAFVLAGNDVEDLGSKILPDQVTVSTWRNKSDGEYNRFHLEIVDHREGEDNHGQMTTTGYLDYDPGENDVDVNLSRGIENPEVADWYTRFGQRFTEMFNDYNGSYRGAQIRDALRDGFIGQASTSVRMRDHGGVYFVPAQYADVLTAFSELFDACEKWKDTGFDLQLEQYEIFDTSDKRQLIQQKVESEMERAIETAIEHAVDALDTDTTAQKAVANAGGELVDAENLAVEHNALLNAELSMQEELERWKQNVSSGSDKEAVVEAAIDSVDV